MSDPPPPKRVRKNQSPVNGWYEEKESPTGVKTWHCRHKGCYLSYKKKSTSTMNTHLQTAHQVNANSMSPFTHPHLLKGYLGATVIALAATPPTTAPTESLLIFPSSSSSSSSPSFPPPSPPLSLSLSQVSVSSQASTASSSSSSFMTPVRSHRPSTQSTVYSAMHAGNNPLVLRAAAKLYAKHALPHRLADSRDMDEFLRYVRYSSCNWPSRAAIKQAQSELAARLRVEMVNKLRQYSVGSPISIAIDGWTNTRHHKVTNLLCLCGGQAYYWGSIVNRYDKNTATWLLKPISTAIADLTAKGIRITALVADNEAVNGKLYRLLKPQFPFLLLSPCAAHTIQLCVNKALRIGGIMEVMTTMEGIIRQFRKGERSKILRQRLANLQRQVQGEKGIKPLIIPCDTRWSSHRAAGVRLLELQRFVVMCELPTAPADSFWLQLTELMDFLRPFQDATDIIQADNSTLYSVFDQFNKLLLYVASVQPTSTFYSAMPLVHNIIVNNWETHVNKRAAICCAWFSFDKTVRDLDENDLTAARVWFVDYALLYAKQWNLARDMSDSVLRGKVNVMWGQFTTSAVGSKFAEFDKLASDIEAAQKEENRRLVNGKWVTTWYPVHVWRTVESEVPLFANPAIGLLCVAGSEAAVERSFSAQDTVHTKKRNRLTDQSVQNEMFIRFNSDAVEGVEREQKVVGGNCIELTDESAEQPSGGSVKALFKAIAIVAASKAAEQAAAEAEERKVKEAAAVGEGREEAVAGEGKKEAVADDGKEEATDSSDSEYQTDTESESGSDSSVEPTQVEVVEQMPVSRSATIAKQVKLDEFLRWIIEEQRLTTATSWRSTDVTNAIEAASIEWEMRMQTGELKRHIKARLASGVEYDSASWCYRPSSVDCKPVYKPV